MGDRLTPFMRRIRRLERTEDGTALVEFAIVATLLFALLFGIIEFGLAFRDRLTISNATQSAARIGSALGDNDEADYEILRSLEQSLATLPNSGIDTVRYVDVFLAGSGGDPAGNCAAGNLCNRYTWSPDSDPLTCDWTPCPDPASPPLTFNWAPSSRDVALPDLDVLGVRLTFSHHWVTGGLIPLPNVECDGTPGSGCWRDTALMRLEPQQFGS